jgi:hypothetical protein
MKLDSVQQRVVRDRAGVGRPLPQGLAIDFSSSTDVARRDRSEGQKLYGLNLDLPVTNAVAATGLDLGTTPEPKRDGDIPGQHPFPKLSAENHRPRLRQPPLRPRALFFRPPPALPPRRGAQSAVRRSVMGVKYLAIASGRSNDSEMNMAPESPASDSAWATLPRSSLSTS